MLVALSGLRVNAHSVHDHFPKVCVFILKISIKCFCLLQGTFVFVET